MTLSTARFLSLIPPSPMNFEVAVVEFPTKHLIDMKVSTDMQKAQTDCPTMWQTFGPRIVEIPGGGCVGKGAYGVSIMLNENDFDYWAAVEAASGTAMPDGMAAFDFPAGLYAKCRIASLENLGEAFTYVYGLWIFDQPEYGLNCKPPASNCTRRAGGSAMPWKSMCPSRKSDQCPLVP